MLILAAGYSLVLGKFIERTQTVAKIMMFMNNDRGGLRGFTHTFLVPGS